MKKPKAPESQSQSDKFKAMAKELECEDSAAPLDRALRKATVAPQEGVQVTLKDRLWWHLTSAKNCFEDLDPETAVEIARHDVLAALGLLNSADETLAVSLADQTQRDFW